MKQDIFSGQYSCLCLKERNIIHKTTLPDRAETFWAE